MLSQVVVVVIAVVVVQSALLAVFVCLLVRAEVEQTRLNLTDCFPLQRRHNE